MSQSSIVVIVDISGSMKTFKYLPYAQTDASTFINIMNVGDSLGVVKFESKANVVYPTSGSFVKEIKSQSDQDVATKLIMAFKAKGLTNMSDAISKGKSLLSSSNNPKAMILLSDGLWNRGTDPTIGLPNIPIYTIALGSNGQVQTLMTIASLTKATFHLSPTPFDLSDIYNDIIQDTNVAVTLKSQQHILAQNTFKQSSAVYSDGAKQATFAVNWGNTSVAYTPNTPTGEQVNVALRGPNGKLTTKASAVGKGFVVFKVPNPTAGDYTAAAWYSGKKDLQCTIGLFDPDLDLKLSASADNEITSVGTPVNILSAVHESGTKLEGAKVTMVLESPTISPEEAIEKNKQALEKHDAGSSGTNVNAQMMNLQIERGPLNLLIPNEKKTLLDNSHADSGVSFTPITRGAHIVRVKAEGTSSKTNRKYTLHKRVSVFVE